MGSKLDIQLFRCDPIARFVTSGRLRPPVSLRSRKPADLFRANAGGRRGSGCWPSADR